MQNKYTLQRPLKARLTKADRSLTAMWRWKGGVGWTEVHVQRCCIFRRERKSKHNKTKKKPNKHKPYSNRTDDTVGEVKIEKRGPVKRLL